MHFTAQSIPMRAQEIHAVPERLADVELNGQVQLLCQLKLAHEHALLIGLFRKIIMVIEADFAEGYGLIIRQRRAQFSFPIRAWV